MDIISAIDGEKRLNACLLSLELCNEKKPCSLHNLINPTRSILMKNLKKKSINELILDVKNRQAILPL